MFEVKVAAWYHDKPLIQPIGLQMSRSGLHSLMCSRKPHIHDHMYTLNGGLNRRRCVGLQLRMCMVQDEHVMGPSTGERLACLQSWAQTYAGPGNAFIVGLLRHPVALQMYTKWSEPTSGITRARKQYLLLKACTQEHTHVNTSPHHTPACACTSSSRHLSEHTSRCTRPCNVCRQREAGKTSHSRPRTGYV